MKTIVSFLKAVVVPGAMVIGVILGVSLLGKCESGVAENAILHMKTVLDEGKKACVGANYQDAVLVPLRRSGDEHGADTVLCVDGQGGLHVMPTK